MFNRQSDYAVNKANNDAIVCPSVDGHDVHITREDLSEEEFLFWKNWSDTDYHETELHDRRIFDDHVVAFNENLCAPGESPEDMLIAAFEKAVHDRKCFEQVTQIRHNLTETQFRRLWYRYAEKKTETEIAEVEKVTQQAVAQSIRDAKKRFLKKSSFDKKTPCKRA